MAEIEETLGGVDILVNSAGLTHMRTLWEITPAEWDDLFAVNLRPVFFLAPGRGRHARRRGPDHQSRLGGRAGLQDRAARTTARRRPASFVDASLRVELAPHGITVNGVAPGLVDTAMSR